MIHWLKINKRIIIKSRLIYQTLKVYNKFIILLYGSLLINLQFNTHLLNMLLIDNQLINDGYRSLIISIILLLHPIISYQH
jgi:hypothetical protein